MNRIQIEDTASKIIYRCMNTGDSYGVFVSDRNEVTISRSSVPYFGRKANSPYQTLVGVYDARASAAGLSDDIADAMRSPA